MSEGLPIDADQSAGHHDGDVGASSVSADADGKTVPRRRHRRVVRKGTEYFDADGVKEEPSDMRPKGAKDADDDNRILGELPPHWGVFSAEKE